MSCGRSAYGAGVTSQVILVTFVLQVHSRADMVQQGQDTETSDVHTGVIHGNSCTVQQCRRAGTGVRTTAGVAGQLVDRHHAMSNCKAKLPHSVYAEHKRDWAPSCMHAPAYAHVVAHSQEQCAFCG
jgi:hypothetical protein